MKCPNCAYIFFDHTKIVRIKRRGIILKCITKEINTGALYSLCRKKGYSMTRKTFLRDIFYLYESNKLKLKEIQFPNRFIYIIDKI